MQIVCTTYPTLRNRWTGEQGTAVEDWRYFLLLRFRENVFISTFNLLLSTALLRQMPQHVPPYFRRNTIIAPKFGRFFRGWEFVSTGEERNKKKFRKIQNFFRARPNRPEIWGKDEAWRMKMGIFDRITPTPMNRDEDMVRDEDAGFTGYFVRC